MVSGYPITEYLGRAEKKHVFCFSGPTRRLHTNIKTGVRRTGSGAARVHNIEHGSFPGSFAGHGK